MKTIYLLLLLVIIIIGVLIYQKYSSNEGFEDSKKHLTQQDLDVDTTQMHSCPKGMGSYMTDTDTLCCSGRVENNECLSPNYPVCTLTPNQGSKFKACSAYRRDYLKLNSKNHCPTSMPNFFEDDSKTPTISGCAGSVNKDGTAPIYSWLPKCSVYSNPTDNTNRSNSCLNQKEVDELNVSFCQAFKVENCSVWTQDNSQGPPLINASWPNTPGSTPFTLQCTSPQSAKRAIRAVGGDDMDSKLAAIENGTDPSICGYIPPVPPCNPDNGIKSIDITSGGPYGGTVSISQIVVKDNAGKNIANTATVAGPYASRNFQPITKIIDGKLEPLSYGEYYESNNNESYPRISLTFPEPYPCISSITYYGAKGFNDPSVNPNNMNMKMSITNKQGKNMPVVDATTDKSIQVFEVNPEILAIKASMKEKRNQLN